MKLKVFSTAIAFLLISASLSGGWIRFIFDSQNLQQAISQLLQDLQRAAQDYAYERAKMELYKELGVQEYTQSAENTSAGTKALSEIKVQTLNRTIAAKYDPLDSACLDLELSQQVQAMPPVISQSLEYYDGIGTARYYASFSDKALTRESKIETYRQLAKPAFRYKHQSPPRFQKYGYVENLRKGQLNALYQTIEEQQAQYQEKARLMSELSEEHIGKVASELSKVELVRNKALSRIKELHGNYYEYKSRQMHNIMLGIQLLAEMEHGNG